MSQTSLSIPHHIASEAVEWQLAIQAGEASEEDIQPWLNEDELHQKAWAHIQKANQRLTILADPAARAVVLTSEGEQRRKALKALTLLFFAGGTATLAYREAPWQATLADISTAVGETRELTLENGTRLNLNTATAVNINRVSDRLMVSLIQGEIMVTTASSLGVVSDHNELPLSVKTAQGELHSLGTRFTVSQHKHHTEVAVFEGRVAAYPQGAVLSKVREIKQTSIIEQGQRGTLFADRLGELLPANEIDTAWVNGMLVASSQPLGEFINTLSRYRVGYLGCDPSIASMQISGTYPLDNTDHILQLLSDTLPVKIRSISPYWVRVVSD